MSDNNLPGAEPGPVDDAPISFGDGVEKLSNLLADPETDLPEAEEEAKAGDEIEGEEPEIAIDPEDVETEETAQEADGSDAEIKGGRFAPDNAKVTLDDGTVTTIADLKRGTMFQRDYTKKTTELAEQRKTFEARQSEVDQQAQTLRELAEKITTFSQKYLPKPPEPFTGSVETDPIGYMRHMQSKADYDAALAEFNGLQAGTQVLSEADQRKATEAAQANLMAEMQALKAKDPLFTNEAKARAFFEEAVTKGAEWWGLTPEEVGNTASHKAILILRDAMLYRKAVAKAKDAQKQVQAKPILPKVERRASSGTRISADKQAQTERLRRSGSLDDAVAILKNLPL